MADFKLSSLRISLPFGIGSAKLELNEDQIEAAWSLYVEYATRIATQPLEPGTGSVREALNSLHSLFGTTREVLRKHGAGVGQSPESIGPLAIRLLNEGVRPFLVKWHTELTAYENAETLRQQQTSLGAQHRYVIDESKWSGREGFYRELEILRLGLVEYVEALAKLAGVTKAHASLRED